ncbi:transporter substrate-binding domain-containing protein [Malaciobacter sp. WC5094]
MKNIHFIILFLNFILVSCLASDEINLTKEEKQFIKDNPIINVGVEKKIAPFYFKYANEYTGLSKKYLNIISKKTGLEFKEIEDSWQNILEKTKNKKIDLIPLIVKNKYRESNFIFSDPYLTARDYAFINTNDSTEYKSLNDLKGKRFAVVKGYPEIKFMQENYPSIEIVYTNNLLETIDAVVTQKADFFLSNIAIANYMINANSINNIKPEFYTNEMGNVLHIAIRKDYIILRNIINKVLSSIPIEEKIRLSNIWMDEKLDIVKSKINFTKEEQSFLKNKSKLIIANEYDWIPFDFYENDRPKGYIVDYIKLISSKLGLEPVFITDNWTQLLKKFKENKIDVLPVIAYSENREKYLEFTYPIFEQVLSIVTKKSTTNIINIDDLKNKKLGMVKDWQLTKVIKKEYPQIEIVEYKTLKEIFDAIKNNYIDGSIQNNLLARYYINKYYSRDLKITSSVIIPNFKNELYIGVRKDLIMLKKLINKAINSLNQKELELLNQKWLNYAEEINFTKEEQEFIENTTINVAYGVDWAPISFVENDKAYGLGFDFWQYITNKANLKVNFDFKSNFTNALEDIKYKRNDIIISTSKTNDREKYAIFSDTYYKAPLGIATLNNKNYIPDASYLLNKKVGVGKDFTAYRLLKEAYPKMKFIFYNDIKQGLEYLSNNKVDVIVDSMPILVHNIKKYAYSNIKISGSTGISFDLQVMIRDDYKVLQSIINKVLKTMTSEERRVIYDKWSKLEYTQVFDYSILWKYFLPLLIIIFVILYKNRQLLKYQNSLKQTKSELENTVENFRALINLTIEGIFIVKGNRILFTNIEAIKMFNLNKKKLKDLEFDSLFKYENKQKLDFIIKEAKTKTYELSAIKKNAKVFPVLLKSKTIFFENKYCDIVSVIDMSEIKDKEQLIIHQSKMASLGEMIGNIAHQWRQPLSFISTAATGMKLQKQFNQLDDKTFNTTIDNIAQTTMFLSQTIDDFQNYLKTDKTKIKFNLSKSIEKLLNIVKSSFSNNFIEMELNLDKEIFITSYENELTQALLNIINNAKDALKDKEYNTRYITINCFKNKNNVFIEVIDNAGGVKPEFIDRVFEPYFTTKHKSQGTGLGLYMTHKIVNESLNGEIKIENISYIFQEKSFDKCAKVTIKLPLS